MNNPQSKRYLLIYRSYLIYFTVEVAVKHAGNEIVKLLSQKGVKRKDFANLICMNDVDFSEVLKKSTIDASLLETISKALGVPVSYFFDERATIIGIGGHLVSGSGNTVEGDVCYVSCQAELDKAKLEIKYLQQVIDEKERIISLLMSK